MLRTTRYYNIIFWYEHKNVHRIRCFYDDFGKNGNSAKRNFVFHHIHLQVERAIHASRLLIQYIQRTLTSALVAHPYCTKAF